MKGRYVYPTLGIQSVPQIKFNESNCIQEFSAKEERSKLNSGHTGQNLRRCGNLGGAEATEFDIILYNIFKQCIKNSLKRCAGVQM